MARAGRRAFLSGLLAAGMVARPSWADAGSPVFLSAAAVPDGGYLLCGITANFDVVFRIPLPGRGHAAAAHPTRPEAVAFARRPGTFPMVIDCATGQRKATLSAPEGRHFYGHGTFSADGSRLYTTENDFAAGRGRIGIWDAHQGYLRIGETDSGGIGPHDIARLPGSETLVIANGGIDTHPDSGRTKLNIPTMRPNLAYLEESELVETATLPKPWNKNSIRHLAVSATGKVAFGMQWQGDGPAPALIGLHQRGQAPHVVHVEGEDIHAMRGYIGSIAFADQGKTIAATSPRGGILQFFDAHRRTLIRTAQIEDVCGVASHDGGLTATSGTGRILQPSVSNKWSTHHRNLRWDNHLIAV